MPLLIWLIDDSAGQHAVARATVALVAGVELVGYSSGTSALAAYAASARSGERLPDVVLMDFQLGPERGDQVTRRWRSAEPPGHRAQVIGYSSAADGSAAILAAGGDEVVRKHADDAGVNPSLLRFLRRRIGA